MVHCIFVVFELFSFGGKNIPSKTTCLTGLAILVLQTQQLKQVQLGLIHTLGSLAILVLQTQQLKQRQHRSFVSRRKLAILVLQTQQLKLLGNLL